MFVDVARVIMIDKKEDEHASELCKSQALGDSTVTTICNAIPSEEPPIKGSSHLPCHRITIARCELNIE
ncbi:unnamed protein product [Macrosiphum euphorbiae]|uniref:Uncharacterized protein n=1 Tax=Macrosiphum euphorbiae TaxID=13131 RepID=A0AAV0XA95_9HEMI|nr:unnamed protein product [Macrosiphum euphorbiae]